jgi:hypothetical protein
MLSFVVLVRGLSEQSMGLYSLMYSVIPVITTLASLGLDQALRRFQPEYLQAGNTASANWLLGVVIRIRLLSNVILIAALLLAWNLIAPIFHLTDQLHALQHRSHSVFSDQHTPEFPGITHAAKLQRRLGSVAGGGQVGGIWRNREVLSLYASCRHCRRRRFLPDWIPVPASGTLAPLPPQ